MALINAITRASEDPIIPQYAGERKLDYSKLELIPDPSLRSVLKSVFDNTQYIPWHEIMSSLIAGINSLRAKHPQKKFYVHNNSYKFKSDLLIICMIWPYIKDIVIDVIDLQYLPAKASDVLFIDDFIVSGCNICSHIDEFCSSGRKDVNFFIVVAFKPQEFVFPLDDINIEIYAQDRIQGIKVNHRTIRQLHINALDDGKPDNSQNELLLSTIYPFYTDHKISSAVFNIPYVYHYGSVGEQDLGCMITYPPDESIKTTIWERYFKDLIKEPTLYNYD